MPLQEDDLLRTRATLLVRLKNWEDRASWQQFFDTYWSLIYGVARRSGLNQVEAEDVVQETMAAVAKHIPTFQYDPALGSFKTWLLNLTRWRITDQLRSRAAPAHSSDAANSEETATAPIEHIADPVTPAWEEEWRNHLMHSALSLVKSRVDPEKYQIFDFYTYKEWTAEKVAESFGTSVEQVYLIKHRVTEMLREEVKRLEKQQI